MCGIVGEFSFSDQLSNTDWPVLTQLMSWRGPDDGGFWTDDKRCVFGFRRLAILDLAPTGHQPMLTQDGRYAIVYNGEMYNFQTLRQDLERRGIRFRSTGDTEVVLYALAEWGKAALERFNGMFALSFYDSQEQRLLLARDHVGIKPLYYSYTAHGLAFASQYDQILAHPWSRNLPISLESLGLYLRQGYIPAPYALLKQTHMLEPGSWVEVDALGTLREGRYFSFPQYQQPDLYGEEAYEAVNAAIADAVKSQMISDVPIGTFLSGGIDSPLVAAKMRAARADAVPAFTIGLNGDPLDESVDAAVYAHELELQHHIEPITSAQALAMLDNVIAACGEPFADYSIFPTMLITQMARKQVTVILSGDGGDELFWGYSTRFGSIIEKSSDFGQPQWIRTGRWALKKYLNLGDGYYNLRFPSIGDWYKAKHFHLPDDWISSFFSQALPQPDDYSLFDFRGGDTEHTAQWVRWNEIVGHLTRVLLKVDRASMYHSLEVRVPFLDRDVIAVAARVDWRSCLNLETGIGKIPLRRSLSRHLQHQTMAKHGFEVPMAKWLHEDLRGAVYDALLSRKELLGLPFDSSAAARFFSQHLDNALDHSWGLWILLSLALWEKKHYHAC